MSDLAASQPPDKPWRRDWLTTPDDSPDQDEPNPFGPDAPNVREDDPLGGQVVPEMPPPSPPETVLDDDQFAPDEA